MFLLDSLMISGIRWALETVVTAAEAEMNDDTALREQLLEAEMRREMGEISDDEFAEVEADLLARIREIKERREGGSGPLAFGEGEPIASSADERFQVEASLAGDFYDAGSNSSSATEPTPATDARSQVQPVGVVRTARTARKSRATRTSQATRTTRRNRARVKPRT